MSKQNSKPNLDCYLLLARVGKEADACDDICVVTVCGQGPDRELDQGPCGPVQFRSLSHQQTTTQTKPSFSTVGITHGHPITLTLTHYTPFLLFSLDLFPGCPCLWLLVPDS